MESQAPARTPEPPAAAALRPVHTPYADRAGPFAIGAQPLAPEAWFEPDGELGRYLEEKNALFAAAPAEVLRTEAGSEPAQAETLAAMTAHLTARHPAIFTQTDADIIDVRTERGRRRVMLNGDGPKIWTAAQLVQEDLLIMEASPEGWRLTAGALCFPSSWSLPDKIGRPLDIIHETVPGFGPGARNATVIERMFSKLRPGEPVLRKNWSIYGDARLDHPRNRAAWGKNWDALWATHPFARGPHLRVERQTLMKLPETSAILFTVKIHVDPIEALETHPDGKRLSEALAAQIKALTPPQLAYKGLANERRALLARLQGKGAG